MYIYTTGMVGNLGFDPAGFAKSADLLLQYREAECKCMLQCVAVCCREAECKCMLQCVAVCCSVLQCVAVCCSVGTLNLARVRVLRLVSCFCFRCTFQCIAECCRVLRSVAECCRVLQSVSGCCSGLQCVVVYYCVHIIYVCDMT